MFARPEASFNESEGRYTMCIVKDSVTAQRVTVLLSDDSGTALRDEGKLIIYIYTTLLKIQLSRCSIHRLSLGYIEADCH